MDASYDAIPTEYLRSVFLVPVRPQTYKNLLYLSLALPLGAAYLAFLSVGVTLGLGLSVVAVGIPILGVVLAVSLGLVAIERHLAALLLDLELDPPSELPGDSRWELLKALLTDARTWTPLVYLPSVFLVGTASMTLVMVVFTTGFSMLLIPLYYDQPGLYVGLVANRPVELHPALYLGWNNLLIGFETVISLGAWRVRTLTDGLLAGLLGGTLCLVGFHLTNLLARSWKWYAAVMIGQTYDPLPATLRVLEE